MVAGQKYPGSNILFVSALEMNNIGHSKMKKALSGEYRKMLMDVDRSGNAFKGRKIIHAREIINRWSITIPNRIQLSAQHRFI